MRLTTNFFFRTNSVNDLLKLMYQDGFLSSTEVAALRKTCRDLKETPVRVLRSLNVATSIEVQSFLQRFSGCLAVTDALLDALDESFNVLIPHDLALNYSVFAVAEKNGKLFVALEDPTDLRTFSAIEFFLGQKIVPCAATVQQLARGLCFLYGFDVTQLKLSTLLETSRGVVGGKAFDPPAQQRPPAIEKMDTFLVDSNLADFESPEPVQAPDNFSIPTDSLVKISTAVNTSLLRLALQKDKSNALTILNQCLAIFDLTVFDSNEGLTVQYKDEAALYSANPELQSPILKMLAPALDRIKEFKEN